MASSNASEKRITNYLRSSLIDEKMSSHSILNIEYDLSNQIG